MAQLTVEDHGNGFMVLGTLHIHKAKKELRDYVDDVEPYKFNLPLHYKDGPAVWLSVAPGLFWDGATDVLGNVLPR